MAELKYQNRRKAYKIFIAYWSSVIKLVHDFLRFAHSRIYIVYLNYGSEINAVTNNNEDK